MGSCDRKIQEDGLYTAAKELFVDAVGEGYKPEFWWMQLLESQRFKNWPSTRGKTIEEVVRSLTQVPEDPTPSSSSDIAIQNTTVSTEHELTADIFIF